MRHTGRQATYMSGVSFQFQYGKADTAGAKRLFWAFALFLLLLSGLLTAAAGTAYAEGNDVYFEGVPLASGLIERDGIGYALLSEIAEAEQFTVERGADSPSFAFDWRLSRAVLNADSAEITYLDEIRTLDAPAILSADGADLLVPVLSFCDAVEIGTWTDDEYGTLYCTAGAGDWELPGGYTVAVMMYHGTGHADPTANLMMPPESLEDQLQYITENGYTTVCFEDLWNVANIEKPVMLIFDDGWSNNYRNLYPLLQKYNCKATIAVVENFTDEGSHQHMTSEEVRELSQSGYVSIQSHTVTHCLLAEESAERQEYEMSESKRFITRLTGKEPFALIYPTGSQNDTTLELMTDYYRFGVKMVGNPWNTSDDPRLIYRFFPENNTYIALYAQWLKSAFD